MGQQRLGLVDFVSWVLLSLEDLSNLPWPIYIRAWHEGGGMSYLCNVFTDFFRGKTKGTDFWREGGWGTDFTALSSEVDDFDLIGIDFWRHGDWLMDDEQSLGKTVPALARNPWDLVHFVGFVTATVQSCHHHFKAPKSFQFDSHKGFLNPNHTKVRWDTLDGRISSHSLATHLPYNHDSCLRVERLSQ